MYNDNYFHKKYSAEITRLTNEKNILPWRTCFHFNVGHVSSNAVLHGHMSASEMNFLWRQVVKERINHPFNCPQEIREQFQIDNTKTVLCRKNLDFFKLLYTKNRLSYLVYGNNNADHETWKWKGGASINRTLSVNGTSNMMSAVLRDLNAYIKELLAFKTPTLEFVPKTGEVKVYDKPLLCVNQFTGEVIWIRGESHYKSWELKVLHSCLQQRTIDSRDLGFQENESFIRDCFTDHDTDDKKCQRFFVQAPLKKFKSQYWMAIRYQVHNVSSEDDTGFNVVPVYPGHKNYLRQECVVHPSNKVSVNNVITPSAFPKYGMNFPSLEKESTVCFVGNRISHLSDQENERLNKQTPSYGFF